MNEAGGEAGPPVEERPVCIADLAPADWQVLRDLKLRSIEQERIAFEDPGVGREKYLERSEAEWREILSGKLSGGREGESLMVFAKDGKSREYIGMVSAIVPGEQAADAKTATVQHMYVDSAGYRGKGSGKLLLRALLERLRARGDIRRIELQVVETQLPAIRLYQGFGFQETRRIPGGAQREGKSFDELEMVLELPETDPEQE